MSLGADILPDETEVDLMALVKEYGWSLVDVYPDDEESENTPSFVFSVNLDEYCGWPELVVVGLPQHVAHSIIANLIDEAKAGLIWNGTQVRSDTALNGFTVVIRPMDQSYWGEYLAASTKFRAATGRPEISGAAQVFWPDDEGRFPWDDGFELHDRQIRLDLPEGANETRH